MKEKRHYRRFDGIAMLAALGCLGMVLFQFIFVFELYHLDAAKFEPFLPEAVKPFLSRWVTAADPLPVEELKPEVESVPAQDVPEKTPAEREPPAEEPPPPEEAVPVG